MKKKLVNIGIMLILLTVLLCGCNESNNKSDENDNKENNILNYKIVIIRNDDVGFSNYLPAYKWISDLALSKNFKVTLSIIPKTLVRNPDTIDYLKQLNQDFFEFAPHGYEHTHFKGLPYEQQYLLIENATNIFKENLNYTPITFVPPYGSSDTNTTLVLKNLGYYCITDMRGSPCYVTDFISDFEYETSYDPIEHCSFDEFKNCFDKFYNSSDEYFKIYLHSRTFLNDNNQLNESRCRNFEEIIDYMKSKDVQFMTIKEAYLKQNEEI
jgi:peptidoglycan/xylan/chitin deacetylase (PgdA/CDA1 family)